MRNRVGAPARATAVVLILLAASLPVLEGPRGSAAAAPGGRSGPFELTGPRSIPPPPLSPPRHVEVVTGACNLTTNAEVVQAYDRALGYLYEAWIGCGGIGFGRSIDGGFSFDTALTVPGSGIASTWDPSIALSPNGTVYVGYMRNDGSGDAPAVAWSFDHGASFGGWAPAFGASLGEFSDRDYLAVAPNGTLFLTWDYSPFPSYDVIGCPPGASCYFTAGDFNIVLATSTDGGVTWSSPRPVNPEYPWGGAPSGPILVEPNGAVDILFEDYNVTPTHVLTVGRNYFTQSVDGGVTFSAPVPVSNLTFANTTWWINGQLARDASGTLYATFDAPGVGIDTAYAVVSRSDGLTWSAPIALESDASPFVQALVGVGGGPNGTAYVAWMTNNSSGSWRTYEAELSGNGSSLSAPFLVSDQVGAPLDWVGDTLGVSDLGGGAVAVSWSYGAPGSPGSEVYAAVVGESVPLNAPRVTSVVPGVQAITLGWLPPASPDRVGGYRLFWGIESQRPNNETLPGTASFFTITPLGKGIHWQLEVAATNGAGMGPTSAPIVVVLTAWSIVSGNVTPASATVTLDGVPLSVTNGTFSANTTEGAHLLSARATNYQTEFDSVILPWNSTEFVNLSLTEVPGAIEGNVLPVAAQVAVDGVAANVSSLGHFNITGLVPGTHHLTANFGGYVAYAVDVNVSANATTWTNLTLLPVNATLTVILTPGNGSLLVDGHPIHLNGSGVAVVTETPGTHLVQASASGFVAFSEDLTLNTSEVRTLTITLVAVPPTKNTTTPSSFPLTGYLLVGLAVGVALVVAAAALLVHRRRVRERSGKEPGQLWESDDEATEAPPPSGPPRSGP
jgi:hypothetical protein